MKNTTTICIDLAKNVYQAAVFNKFGSMKKNQKLNEKKLVELVAKHPESIIIMEACGTAHYWGRRFESMGHRVKLVPAHIAAKYRTGNKNDANDTLAIYEASNRKDIYFVKVKTIEQQDLACLLRLRQGYIKQRTQIANRARGLGMEYGVKIPRTVSTLRKRLPDYLEDPECGLTPASRYVLNHLLEELCRLDDEIKEITKELTSLARQVESCRLLVSLPGVSWIVASALYARFGDGSAYKCGRDASASVGLVPGHSGTGGQNTMHGISKRGDRYLRSLVVHGARAVVCAIKEKQDKLSCWIRDQLSRNHLNKTVVALANKIVRMALAMLKSGASYQPEVA